MSHLRNKPHERAYGSRRRFTGAFLDATPGENEGYYHHRRIIICVPLNATRTPERIAPERVEHTEKERYARTHGYKRVHIGRTVKQLAHGIDVKRASAICNVEQCGNEHELIGSRSTDSSCPTHRHRHHEKGEKPRQEGVSEQQTVVVALNGIHAFSVVDDEFVTHSVYFALHISHAYRLFIILHNGRATRQRHRHRLHALQ